MCLRWLCFLLMPHIQYCFLCLSCHVFLLFYFIFGLCLHAVSFILKWETRGITRRVFYHSKPWPQTNTKYEQDLFSGSGEELGELERKRAHQETHRLNKEQNRLRRMDYTKMYHFNFSAKSRSFTATLFSVNERRQHQCNCLSA